MRTVCTNGTTTRSLVAYCPAVAKGLSSPFFPGKVPGMRARTYTAKAILLEDEETQRCLESVSRLFQESPGLAVRQKMSAALYSLQDNINIYETLEKFYRIQEARGYDKLPLHLALPKQIGVMDLREGFGDPECSNLRSPVLKIEISRAQIWELYSSNLGSPKLKFGISRAQIWELYSSNLGSLELKFGNSTAQIWDLQSSYLGPPELKYESLKAQICNLQKLKFGTSRAQNLRSPEVKFGISSAEIQNLQNSTRKHSISTKLTSNKILVARLKTSSAESTGKPDMFESRDPRANFGSHERESTRARPTTTNLALSPPSARGKKLEESKKRNNDRPRKSTIERNEWREEKKKAATTCIEGEKEAKERCPERVAIVSLTSGKIRDGVTSTACSNSVIVTRDRRALLPLFPVLSRETSQENHPSSEKEEEEGGPRGSRQQQQQQQQHRFTTRLVHDWITGRK
ncbi:hypothetical protein WH47_07115 [Habropoda laboriosa]|uniref:Uncharacterized protein n=1 Tax=Habropoda laboriosa TaxID=597456 RepID=A0A0L7QPV2_9HYME|nr:hypothetical protein WH47_07115 [Habropoda laboriosa]